MEIKQSANGGRKCYKVAGSCMYAFKTCCEPWQLCLRVGWVFDKSTSDARMKHEVKTDFDTSRNQNRKCGLARKDNRSRWRVDGDSGKTCTLIANWGLIRCLK